MWGIRLRNLKVKFISVKELRMKKRLKPIMDKMLKQLMERKLPLNKNQRPLKIVLLEML